MNEDTRVPGRARAVPPPLPAATHVGGGWPAGVPAMSGISDPWGRPQGVLGYAGPAGPGRPVSVLVVSILGLVFAAWMLYLTLNGLMAASRMREMTTSFFRTGDGFDVYYARLSSWMTVVAIAHLALAVWLAVGSIGSMCVARWAWALTIAYALAHLVWLVVAKIVFLSWVAPSMREAFGAVSGPTFTARDVVMTIVHAVVPVLILVFWTRSRTRVAFGRSA